MPLAEARQVCANCA